MLHPPTFSICLNASQDSALTLLAPRSRTSRSRDETRTGTFDIDIKPETVTTLCTANKWKCWQVRAGSRRGGLCRERQEGS